MKNWIMLVLAAFFCICEVNFDRLIKFVKSEVVQPEFWKISDHSFPESLKENQFIPLRPNSQFIPKPQPKIAIGNQPGYQPGYQPGPVIVPKQIKEQNSFIPSTKLPSQQEVQIFNSGNTGSLDTFPQTNIFYSNNVSKIQWSQFKIKFNKRYRNQAEQVFRLLVYARKKKDVQIHNANVTKLFRKGINKFSDITKQEYVKTYLGTVSPPRNPSRINAKKRLSKMEQMKEYEVPPRKFGGPNRRRQDIPSKTVSSRFLPRRRQVPDNPPARSLEKKGLAPSEASQQQSAIQSKKMATVVNIDWRRQGIFHNVAKEQGKCGSCYIFATIAGIQTHIKIKKGLDYVFSQQQIIDCCSVYEGYNCHGCQFGSLRSAFDYSNKYGNINHFKYPYTSYNRNVGDCRYNLYVPNYFLYKIQPYRLYQPSTDIWFTWSLLENYPLVALADATNWDPYDDGIFDDCSNYPVLNHGVLIVGVQPSGAWIVKNWFGTTWGQDGYIRIDKNLNCGINSIIVAPRLRPKKI